MIVQQNLHNVKSERGVVLENQQAEETGSRVSIVKAWKESPRSHRAMIAIVLVYLLMTGVVHLLTWLRHDIPLRPGMVAFAMLSMLAILIWHSVTVKGVRQTVAFFLLSWAISWFCEFIGHNYGWFFGKYHYTGTLGPRIGGVPILIIVTWSVLMYSAFMLIDWLIGMKGEKRARSWWGKTLWAGLIAAASAMLVCAWDLMVDPFATSRVWMIAVHRDPWWYWINGGPYLKELPGLKVRGGVPIGNFVGWWLAPFFVVFIFYLIFQKPNIVSGKLVNTVPLLTYFYVYFAVVVVVLEMNWFIDGMNQVALIGTFTMMPVIMVSIARLIWDYT
ncbi:MAG: carotenoid biosynthesis protein [Actinobacteria bacterium]|nr:carotenoid biosynthesis protein [Actinomycetota bacterium]